MSMLTPAQNAAKCAEVLALLRDLYTPTEADKAHHRQLVADQMARDERLEPDLFIKERA